MGDTLNWISVEDKLPERDTCGRYLIHVKNMANYHHLPNNIIIAEWCFNDWIYGGWEFNYVTHWMPIPEPPESEDVI